MNGALIYTEQLIEQAKRGDEQAFSKLVREWYPRIYNFGYKYFSDHDLAMEVTQRTFIAVHKNLSTLHAYSKFKGWLYRIAINFCHEEERKQKRKWVFPFLSFRKEDDNREPFEHVLGDGATPERDFQQHEISSYLMKALDKLPEDQKLIVIMKEYEGLKFKEIAEALNISENTAKSRLYYGLKALKKTLTDWNITKETIHYEL